MKIVPDLAQSNVEWQAGRFGFRGRVCLLWMSELRPKQKLAIAFSSEDRGIDHVNQSRAEVGNRLSYSRHSFELHFDIFDDPAFAHILTPSFELRLNQNDRFAAPALSVLRKCCRDDGGKN